MTKEESQVSKAIELFHHICLENQNFNEASRMLDEEIEWTDAGTCGCVRGRDTIRALLDKKFLNNGFTYVILKSEYSASMIQPTLFSFSGFCFFQRTSLDKTTEYELHVTGICFYDKHGLRIKQMHHSLPNDRWGEEAASGAVESARVLRDLVGQQSRELKETNANLNALIQNLPGAVICCEYNSDLDLIYYSDGFLNMAGYTREEVESVFENKFSRMIEPEDLEKTWKEVIRQLKISGTKEIEYRVRRKDGTYVVIQDHGQLVQRDGRPAFYCILLDITERRRSDEELRLSLERYQIVMSQTSDVMFEWNIADDTLTYSHNWKDKFGYQPIRERVSAEIPVNGHIHPEDIRIFDRIAKDVMLGVPQGENEIRIEKEDGNYIWCRIHYTLQADQNGLPSRLIGLIADIDREKREKEMLKEMAEKDSLTGLYNRGAVQTLIQRYVVKATPDDCCALMILDVDNFKKINDVYGHLSGDVMLKDIADKLRGLFKKDAFIGRVGGDEFAILMNHVKDISEVEEKAEGVLKSFQEMVLQAGDFVSCSLGISLAPLNGDNFAAIYKNADAALYRAKRRGKNRYAFYEPVCEENNGKVEERGISVQAEEPGRDLEGYVLDILTHSKDMNQSIQQILEIVGRQTGVSRAYIFEDSEDRAVMTNTYEWCNDGVEAQIGFLKEIPLSEEESYYDNFNEEGVFFCRDVTTLLTRDRMLLEAQGIKSMLQCLIMEGDRIKGFIGFDECSGKRYWTRNQILILKMLANILGLFLIKGRAEEQLAKTTASFRAALDDQGDWYYVLEKESCRFLYGNQAIAEIQPKVREGGVCYEVFFGMDHMCEGCPLALMDCGRTAASGVVWNPNLKQYVYASARSLYWPGGKNACMVSCRVFENQEKQEGER